MGRHRRVAADQVLARDRKVDLGGPPELERGRVGRILLVFGPVRFLRDTEVAEIARHGGDERPGLVLAEPRHRHAAQGADKENHYHQFDERESFAWSHWVPSGVLDAADG
jgi:hypothetical protein